LCDIFFRHQHSCVSWMDTSLQNASISFKYSCIQLVLSYAICDHPTHRDMPTAAHTSFLLSMCSLYKNSKAFNIYNIIDAKSKLWASHSYTRMPIQFILNT
jgi:hypothetical protein